MRVPRVYCRTPIEGLGSLDLGADTAHYLGKVLRMAVGRPLMLFDGRGDEYSAQISSLSKSSVAVEITEKHEVDRESPLAIELAIGISRGERFEWVLQKATELGVSTISPLLTERVEVKLPPERLAKKLDHWRQIMISACEQCQRTKIPTLAEPKPLQNWLSEFNSSAGFVLHHRTSKQLSDWQTPPQSISLLVGPEGGLSEEEIASAEQAGLKALNIGPRVMRTETAPLAAISVMQYQWGDF